MMDYARLGLTAAAVVASLAMTTGAQAFCSNNWADVTVGCPNPVPYTGPKTLTDTSRNMPTVGPAPGTIVQWGNTTVRYVKGTSREAGQQPFYWQQ